MPDPVTLTATSSDEGKTWTTDPYYPPSYSGNSYEQDFVVEPESGSFLQASPQSIGVTASDSNGNAIASGSLDGTSTTSQVPLTVMISPPVHHSSFGSGLNLIILLTYVTD